jgi:hypothetical protein
VSLHRYESRWKEVRFWKIQLSASNTKLSTEGGCLCLDDANYQAIARQLSEREAQKLRIAKGSNEEAIE